MRRALSIFLVLFFGLGPLTATLTADDDSRLPSCCRRHGAHHCAMSDSLLARMIQAASGTPILTAPSHCPQYPDSPNATMAPVHAMVSSSAHAPIPPALAHVTATYQTVVPMSQIQAHAGRGPPLPILS